MEPKELEKSLSSVQGWKMINKPFMFFFGGAKKSFPLYESCEKKGVFKNHKLVTHVYDDNIYHIYAFSINGAFDQGALDELKEKAAEIDLGTIRYENIGYTCLELWRGPEDSFAHENNTITELSDIENGIFVYPTGEIDDTTAEFPLVVYGQKGTDHYIYPVSDKHL
ncbi:hypothetical protein [Desulfoluna spongiiphila]|uniref:hypothetical protein n=1 Tax=Desulfoluna spongiiphila TaxID=419481 RepID=UPI001254F90C|nr:hypothetical protein [Desulfoluna spongiiphila]VVS94175.1 hypothetical protein DBB_37470 [Desulfoluna spongiiphila]